MKTFVIAGQEYQAESCVDDILINPLLPENFDCTPLYHRTKEHMKQWYLLPFIQSQDGIFNGYLLNTQCWDRPQLMYADESLDKVIEYFKQL